MGRLEFRRAARATGGVVIAACLYLVLSSLWHLVHVPWTVAAGFLAFSLLACARPAVALMLLAGLIPSAAFAGRSLDSTVAWSEVMVVAFAAGWWLRQSVRPGEPTDLPPAVRGPLVALTTLVVASSVVSIAVLQLRLGTTAAGTQLWAYFARHYFISGPEFPALQAAALLLEGFVLFAAAARTVAAEPRLLRPLTGALVAGAALAAAINVEVLASGVMRFDDPWPRFVAYLSTGRFNAHYGDLNAAGSYFAMCLVAAGGLAVSRARAAWLWSVPGLTIALGLWISGSRTALFACPVVLAGLLAVRLLGASRTRTAMVVAGGGLLALAGFAAVAYAPLRGNQTDSMQAARVRVELAHTTWRMVADSPMFGIGLGQYQQRSGEFSSPELLTLFPPAHRENAHNNYFQVAGELGLLGLVAFLWLLGAAAWSAFGAGNTSGGDRLLWICGGGLAAFLLTCLGGHPLLIREAAFPFWILLGSVAGGGARRQLGSAVPDLSRRRSWTAAPVPLAVVVVLIAASIPVRARADMWAANLEHVGIGLSMWQTAPDGVRYREGVNEAAVFVPTGSAFRLLVQPQAAGPVSAELHLGGRLANVVTLAPGRWNDIAMPLPRSAERARFMRLDLKVRDRTADVPLWITKVEPAGR